MLVVCGCSADQQFASSLTDDRIEELREEYPLSAGSPAYVQTIDVSFDQILEISDAVIIAEVLKQNENFQATFRYATY